MRGKAVFLLSLLVFSYSILIGVASAQETNSYQFQAIAGKTYEFTYTVEIRDPVNINAGDVNKKSLDFKIQVQSISALDGNLTEIKYDIIYNQLVEGQIIKNQTLRTVQMNATLMSDEQLEEHVNSTQWWDLFFINQGRQSVRILNTYLGNSSIDISWDDDGVLSICAVYTRMNVTVHSDWTLNRTMNVTIWIKPKAQKIDGFPLPLIFITSALAFLLSTIIVSINFKKHSGEPRSQIESNYKEKSHTP
ncbi:MAG: hypothetical protein ACTSWN_14835 [Promethearchaeota archaeon]